MAGRKLPPADIPAAGPWLVRRMAELPELHGAGGEGSQPSRPAGSSAGSIDEVLQQPPIASTHAVVGDGPYCIVAYRPERGGNSRRRKRRTGPIIIANGITHLADAELLAAAPDLAERMLALLISAPVRQATHNPEVRPTIDAAWALLVRIAPHLEVR